MASAPRMLLRADRYDIVFIVFPCMVESKLLRLDGAFCAKRALPANTTAISGGGSPRKAYACAHSRVRGR